MRILFLTYRNKSSKVEKKNNARTQVTLCNTAYNIPTRNYLAEKKKIAASQQNICVEREKEATYCITNFHNKSRSFFSMRPEQLMVSRKNKYIPYLGTYPSFYRLIMKR